MQSSQAGKINLHQAMNITGISIRSEMHITQDADFTSTGTVGQVIRMEGQLRFLSSFAGTSNCNARK
jgi:hypothetical protein